MPQSTTSPVVVALYESLNTAEAAVKDLRQLKGLRSENISLFTYEESASSDTGQERASPSFLARLMGDRRELSDVRNALVKLGVADADAQNFAEGLRRGNTLVAVQADASRTQEVRSILERHRPINLNERAQQWRKAGWTGFQADAKRYTAAEAAAERNRYAAASTTGKAGEEQVLPVMEEKLVVGKREVEHGGVQAHTHVVETPVEETVHLREERVTVQRRQANRPVEASALDVTQERTIEVTEKTEEPVVTKQARVIEEVVIRKEATERVETIHDTVRRTDVQVTDTRHAQPAAQPADTAYEQEFRTHYDTHFANSGYTYEQFGPAYRFGHLLGRQERYRGADWNAVEPEAQRSWEERNPGTWEHFKQAIRHAWERVRT